MKIDIITHKKENGKDRSPFDKAICSIAEGNNIKIACPYLSIDYLRKITNKACSWSLITDLEAWLKSTNNSDNRKEISDFLRNNTERVRHIKGLHAKVIINETQSFLGSANFTKNGLEKNEEVSVLISDDEQVGILLQWFDARWKEGAPPRMEEVERYCKELDKIKKPPFPATSLSQNQDYQKPKAYIKNSVRYWRIGTTIDGESIWELMRDQDCVAVGWHAIPDLSEITGNNKSKEKIRTAMRTHHPKDPRVIGKQTVQLFNYLTAISKDDIVLASDGQKVLGIGKVLGKYFYEPSPNAPHRRPVEWLSLEEWKTPEKEGLRTTVHEMKEKENLNEVRMKILNAKKELF